MASTYSSLLVHLVFATDGRAPTIADDWRQDLHNYLGATLKGLGAKPLALGGVADHVHILAELKPTHAVANVVRELKKSSSVWASQRPARFAWQAGYAAFSVARSGVDGVSAYITSQERHHRTVDSADELRSLLKEHGVEADERFFG